MLEVWIDDKKVQANNVRIAYTHKGGERTEIKVQAEDSDTWMSLRQLDSLGQVSSEIESWSDQGRVKRNVTLSAKPAPPNSVKNPTKENIQAWYEEAKAEGFPYFLWLHNIEEAFDLPLGVEKPDNLPKVLERIEDQGKLRIIAVFDMSSSFEEQYRAVEE